MKSDNLEHIAKDWSMYKWQKLFKALGVDEVNFSSSQTFKVRTNKSNRPRIMAKVLLALSDFTDEEIEDAMKLSDIN